MSTIDDTNNYNSIKTTRPVQEKKANRILFLIILFTLCLLLYIFRISRRTKEHSAIQQAALNSEFKQCEFVVYDKSSKTVCDRLIIIEPFNWVLWNTRKNLFVLNPERDIQCSGHNNGAIRMLREEFYETCLDVSYDYIVKNYMTVGSNDVNVHRVPYTINDRVFKITDAINRLMDLDLLSFDLTKTEYNATSSVSNRFTFNRLGTYIPYKRNAYDYEKVDDLHEDVIRHNEQTRSLNSERFMFIDRNEEDLFLDKILQNVYLERETDVQQRRQQNHRQNGQTGHDESINGRGTTSHRTQ